MAKNQPTEQALKFAHHDTADAEIRHSEDPRIMTSVKSPDISSRFETIILQLSNLEPYAEPEKTLNLELNLYQMEDFR